MTGEGENKIVQAVTALQSEVATHAAASSAAVAAARTHAAEVASDAKNAALTAAADVKRALQGEIAIEREQLRLVRVDISELSRAVNKLATARLLQQGFTSLVLAAAIVVGIKAFGG